MAIKKIVAQIGLPENETVKLIQQLLEEGKIYQPDGTNYAKV